MTVAPRSGAWRIELKPADGGEQQDTAGKENGGALEDEVHACVCEEQPAPENDGKGEDVFPETQS